MATRRGKRWALAAIVCCGLLVPATSLASAITIYPTAGQSFSGEVGQDQRTCPVDDALLPPRPNCSLFVGQPTGTITWGDGTAASTADVTMVCPQTLAGTQCTIHVDGTHTYAKGGSYSGSYSWTDSTDSLAGNGTFTALVAGGSRSCPTPPQPVAVTGSVSAVTDTSATVSGTIDPCGVQTSWWFDYGTSSPPETQTAVTALTTTTAGPQSKSVSLTGLIPGTTYYYRMDARTSAGAAPPGLTLSFTTAESPFIVTASGQSPTVYAGVPWSGTLAHIDDSGAGVTAARFAATIDWGDGSAVDHGQVVAASGGGFDVAGTHTYAANANDTTHTVTVSVTKASTTHTVTRQLTVKGISGPPAVTITQPSYVFSDSAGPEGTVNPGGAPVTDCHFDYGETTAYGQSAPCMEDPGIGTAPVPVHAQIGGLHPSTTYHYRLVASNPAGTTQSDDQTFTTGVGCEQDLSGHTIGPKLELGSFGFPAEFQLTALGAPCWNPLGEASNSTANASWSTYGPVAVNGFILDPDDCSALVVSLSGMVTADPGNGCGTTYEVRVPNADGSISTIGQVDLARTPWLPGDQLGEGQLWGHFGPSPFGPKFGADGITGGEVYIPFHSEGEAYLVAHLPLPPMFSTTPVGGPPPTTDLTYSTGGSATDGNGAAETACAGFIAPCGGGGCGCNTYKPPTCAAGHVCPSPTRFTAPDTARRTRAPRTTKAKFHNALALPGHFHLTIPDMYLGALDIKNAFLDYNPDVHPELDGLWSGGGELGIGGYKLNAAPPPPDQGVGIFGNGDFAFGGASLEAPDPGVPIFSGVFLKELGIRFGLKPTRFSGDATINVADVVSIHGGVLVVYANDAYPYTYPPAPCDDDPETCALPGVTNLQADTRAKPIKSFAAGVSGTVSLKVPVLGEVQLASAYVFYIAPSYFEFAGHIDLNLLHIANITGDVKGALDTSSGLYDLNASVNACLNWPWPIGNTCLGLLGHLSSNGIGACLGPVGFRYEWGGDFTPFVLGCADGMGPITVNVYAGRARDAGAIGVNVPAGVPSESIWVKSSGDPPQIQITGPHGERAASTDDPSTLKRIVIDPIPSLHETVIGLKHPSAGRWAITTLPGSAPITSVSHANGLPPARIKATISGHGRSRTLSYDVAPRPGQQVTFAERAGKVFHVIGRAHGARGTLHFNAALGAGGGRQIVAIITLSGAPNTTVVVSHYKAPPMPRASKPAHLRVTRHVRSLGVAWGASRNARGYVVSALLSDGRRITKTVAAGAHRASIPTAGRSVGAVVKVMGIGPDGNPGPSASLRLSPPPAPGRVRSITFTTSRRGVAISWRAVPGARLYLVRVVVTGSHPAEYMLSTKVARVSPSHALLTLKRGDVASVTIRALSVADKLGPVATAKYVPGKRHRHR